jgi:iron complex outermembrane receptor protein
VEPDFTVDAYSLINIFAGVRSQDGAWEASIFARNAFKTQQVLDLQSGAGGSSVLGQAFPQLIHPPGYSTVSLTPRREVGVHVRYAWGSR